MIGLIIGWIIIGLIIGALGRLAVRGPNPMPIWLTVVIGMIASLVGGIITRVIIGGGHGFITFIVSVVLAAVAVTYLSGSRGRRTRV